RLHRGPGRLTQLGIERVHLRYAPDVSRQRRRGGGLRENGSCGIAPWGDPLVGIGHAGRRRLQRLHILDPGRAEQAIGGRERYWIAALRTGEKRLRLGGHCRSAWHPIKRRALERTDELPRGRAVRAASQP